MHHIRLQSLQQIKQTLWHSIRASDLVLMSRKWWQRLLWWLCLKGKLQFDQPVTEMRHEMVAIDERPIVELIDKNRRDMRSIWNREARFLIIGYEEADRLFNDAAHYFWATPINVRMAYGGSYPQYRGLTVVCVPWITKGFFLLPELKEMR